MAYFDWRDKPLWKGLDEDRQLALMGMMERDPKDPDGAYGVMSSVVNRAKHENKSISELLSEKKGSKWGTYQPLYESDQYERAQGYLNDPEFKEKADWAADRRRGFNKDVTGGAVNYLAPEATMLGLEAKEPGKYKSWRGWTKRRPVGTSRALVWEIAVSSASRFGPVTYSVTIIGNSLSPSTMRCSTSSHSRCVSMASALRAREESRMRSMWRSSLYCGSTVMEIDSMEPAGRRSKRAKASLPLCSSAEKCPICGDERMDCSTRAFTGTPSNSNRPS